MGHPGGRPPKLSGEVINEAAVYVDPMTDEQISDATKYIKTFVEKQRVTTRSADHYPTIEGLALELDVSRDTIYRWASENEQFGRIIVRLLNKQAHLLQNLGLNKRYDSGMARLLLSKHGYVPQTENTENIRFDEEGKAKGYMEEDSPPQQ